MIWRNSFIHALQVMNGGRSPPTAPLRSTPGLLGSEIAKRGFLSLGFGC